ncbi:hypothetical protein O6H91_Y445600 [Diphasiastrum complanatum]|nr:hypothetical protein O6H91_Y445600 [Diphasiastrum complanatum]KAJ7237323.1 hypothetical protein O6H91_Y445600 [Diphasiastrum complanatum]
MVSSRGTISLVHIEPQETPLGSERKSLLKASSFRTESRLMQDDLTARNVDVKSQKKQLVLSEVKKHSKMEDAWIIVDGKVYDITRFLESHPGGAQIILDHLVDGDVGALMRGINHPDSHFHSKAAFEMLKQFCIDSLEDLQREHKTTELKDSSANKMSDMEFQVDLSKPLVFQVGKLGDRYQEWVHDPILCKESPRFFESNVAELLTTTKWWIIPLIFVPIIYLMERKALQAGNGFSNMLYYMSLGTVAWTLLEYCIHRFLFHMRTSSYWMNTVHYVLHGFHHKHPMDGSRLVFPPAFSAFFCVLIWHTCSLFVPEMVLPAFYGGLLFGYVIYDLTHYYLHFGRPFHSIGRGMKRYHLNHHFKVQTNAFGITSSMWDQLLGTSPSRKSG